MEPSPARVWMHMLWQLVGAVLSLLFTALLAVLYPLYCLVPRFVLEALFKAVFRVGCAWKSKDLPKCTHQRDARALHSYLIYLTPVGALTCRFGRRSYVLVADFETTSPVCAGHWLHSRSLRDNTTPHSAPTAPAVLSTCTVVVVPLMENNYGYLITDCLTREAALVDPADPHAAARAVEAVGCELTTILTTHGHHDHAGGNVALAQAVLASSGRALTIVGGKRERVPGCTLSVSHGEIIKLGNTFIRVIETPCHTRGHVCFAIESPIGLTEALFSGDTVFIGGVGAFFHGSAQDMCANLNERLAQLPDGCLLYCGHEYTADNLRFAAWLEPDNAEVVGSYLAVQARRTLGESTVPGTMGAERRTNPYFRINDGKLHAALAGRKAWLEARQVRSLPRRVLDAIIGGDNQPVLPVSNPPFLTPEKLYRGLQELLSSGAWQGFSLRGRTEQSKRRRAAAMVKADEISKRRESHSSVGSQDGSVHAVHRITRNTSASQMADIYSSFDK